MASTDARPIPRKNVAYRVTFPIMDADGDLVTGATALDSEISKDGGTFADCTNEATEIATASGMYFLDLSSTEMNADTVAIIVKTTSSGAKTTPIVMYPEELGDVRIDPATVSTDHLDVQTVETGLTVRNSMRLIAAATAGKVSGAETTTATIRNAVQDTKNRLIATVDANGNRTAITYDLT